MKLPEPWIRGIEAGVDPVIGHLLRAAQHIREDLTAALTPLSVEQIWAKPHGMTSAGFHAKHIAGSTQRLCEYLEGRQLTAEQLAEVPLEGYGTEPAGELIAKVEAALLRYENLIRALAPAEFGSVRPIGRQRLQTTAISLAIHITEHAMRHAGQAISASKLTLAVSSAKL